VDRHKTEFASLPLASNLESAQATFAQSESVREMLGEDLYHGIIDHSDPVTTSGSKFADAYLESRAYASKNLPPTAHETTSITQTINDSLESLPSLTRSKGWVEKVKNNVPWHNSK
jgi:hypothetical protein